MELFIAIALLCQVSGSTAEWQLKCQQSYTHCVNVKAIKEHYTTSLNQCILEKKL